MTPNENVLSGTFIGSPFHYEGRQRNREDLDLDAFVSNKVATENLDGGEDTPERSSGTVLIDGGQRSWVQGYDFRVSAANYKIIGELLHSQETVVSLTAADPTLDRIDVIAVNTSGQVVVIEGTAGATPEKPYVDPTTQLELTFVTVFANTTEPPEQVTTNIYDENAGTGGGEWNGVSSSGTIVLGDTTSPRSGTKNINCTAAPVGANAVFTAGSNQIVNRSHSLVLNIKSKSTWGNGNNAKRLILSLLNASDQVVGNPVSVLTSGTFGFDSTVTNYQQIAIQLTSFGIIDGDVIRKVKWQVAGSSGTIGFYMDNIFLDIIQTYVPVDEAIQTNRQIADYTLALSDVDKLVEMNVGIANSLTVPPNSTVPWPVGRCVFVSQYGAGQTTIVAGAGVTIRSADGALKMYAQYSGAVLYKLAANEWYLFGDMTT